MEVTEWGSEREVNKRGSEQTRKHPKTNARGMLRMQGGIVVMIMEIINP